MSQSVGLYMDDDTVAMMDTLCADDQRNRSNMMQWLIAQEYRRRGHTVTTTESEPANVRNCDNAQAQ